ncbi:DUF3173 domain-containing protein [Streptococcus gallolyticus subsp. gallolyticus]|uniref:DUF3173 family protein n=1 Tax=Streptococcus gallolyticus TaxID=315405 RepID=UPI002000DF3A|nr:DUF3173 family protein [Streptococcus gallolyticus]MCY7173166.1 DUF3173 domain-containing protein [Streptococcus gallolyticus subsp. gallolyticus]MCY7175288.1 DUF3173 domain-containing protein [Streptococcus gallolyticus subsp. gallolyticus]MCY7179743.1 DUF3173 domain-containing protein [Streptococcus gallolyticus subsp. gallolyticus]MCY7197294.1 DUF3173 domain-containing protein [Streptococcus gallolyticus subsp. gallolyticus]MCY7204709.1 DUF3173 domain-containing protein [Streptococcus ga
MISIVNKDDVMKLTGFSDSQSKKLIREAKSRLVSEGFSWYKNKRIGRVPIKTIEDILGFELSSKHDIITNVREDTALEKGVSNGSN